MVLDGRSILDKGIVTFPNELYDNETVVQPNGIDLRVDKVFYLAGTVTLPRDKKIQTNRLTVSEIPLKDGAFELIYPEGNYLVDFREDCSMKDGFCGIIIPRSSLLRTGIFVTSALWDTGFHGRLGASIRIRNKIKIQHGAALAQLVVMKGEFNGHRYEGRYLDKVSQTQFN